MIDVEVEDEAWVRAVPELVELTQKAASLPLTALAGELSSPMPSCMGEGGPEGVEGAAAPAIVDAASPPPDGSGYSPQAKRRGGGEVVSRSVTILLTDDDAVAELNVRFRAKPTPTNVLAFPAAPNPEHHLGDIALAFGVCAREAGDQGKPLADHLAHLVIHGVLHLLGYDHQDEAEAERMESLERELLAGLDIPDPYATPHATLGHIIDEEDHVRHRG